MSRRQGNSQTHKEVCALTKPQGNVFVPRFQARDFLLQRFCVGEQTPLVLTEAGILPKKEGVAALSHIDTAQLCGIIKYISGALALRKGEYHD